jgi:hypothetical protein
MSTTSDTMRPDGERSLRELVEPLQQQLFATLDRFALPDDGPTQAVAFAKIYANAEVFGTQTRLVIEGADDPSTARARCLAILRDLALYVATCGPQPVN